ncbi:hypothetical protein V5O48_016169 [Marasmius crinis-equi]|uniref:Phosphoglycerate mutase-like protein n=1 Tax=Marasmius crinis-equi TaxID=585013 RepID=A0ABR3ESF1_9AGAR
MPSARLYIIRHGETNENRLGIIQGHMDTELNEQGIAQSGIAAQTMENVPLTEVWSSDLQRAVKTAQIITEKHPGLAFVSTRKLRERCLGSLEGKHHAQKSKMLSKFPRGIDPSAEAVEVMQERTMNWWDTDVLGLTKRPVPSLDLPNHLNEKEKEKQHHVLVVSHGGFIGSVVRRLIGTGRVSGARPQDWKCFNTSITTIDVDESGRGTLVKYADIGHMLKAVREGRVVENNVDVPLEGMKAVSGES